MLNWIRPLLLLLLLAPWCAAQDHGASLEQARARWERMSPAERARISERFDEFRELPAAERARMESHLRRIADARREIEARIPDELKAKLEQLAPEDRRQVLREYVETTMGERAERLREKLSPELLVKLQTATPAEREELLRKGRDQWREQGAARALQYLQHQLDLSPAEVERIQALPPAERFKEIGDLGRREMQRRGPPPGVDPQEFRDWTDLPPREFMERMHCHGMRGFRGESGPPPAGRGGRGEFGRPGERGQRAGPPDGPPDGPPGGPPDGPPRGPRREGRLSSDARNQLMHASRPDSQWIVELATQSREERREEIFKRIHTRVLDVLRTQPTVTPEEIAQLEGLAGREFFEALREIAGDPEPGFGERRRRDHPRNEPPPPPPPREQE